MSEQMSPLSQEVRDLAWEAAQASNEAYGTLLDTEANIGRVRDVAFLCIDGIEIGDGVYGILAKERLEAQANFNQLIDMAGVVMYQAEDGDPQKSPWSYQELVEQEAGVASDTSETLTGVESLLSPEDAAHATKVVDAMAEKLSIERENIRLVLVETEEHGKQVVAIDASPNGQYGGSYNQVKSERAKKKGKYNITVDGSKIDTLAGTNDAAYRAMIADTKTQGTDLLPDSSPLSQENGEPWTATMLTGEPLTAGGDVRVRCVGDGKVDGGVYRPGYGHRLLRVRPAVVVAQLES
jgi:hypothetical protein